MRGMEEMIDLFTNIAMLGFMFFFILLINSFLKKDDKKGKHAILTGIFFLLFGLVGSIEKGWNGFFEFIGASGLIVGVVFMGLIIHSVLKETGKTKRYIILAVISFLIMGIGFSIAQPPAETAMLYFG